MGLRGQDRARQREAEPGRQQRQPRCLGTARGTGVRWGTRFRQGTLPVACWCARAGIFLLSSSSTSLPSPYVGVFWNSTPICRIVSKMQTACLSLSRAQHHEALVQHRWGLAPCFPQLSRALLTAPGRYNQGLRRGGRRAPLALPPMGLGRRMAGEGWTVQHRALAAPPRVLQRCRQPRGVLLLRIPTVLFSSLIFSRTDPVLALRNWHSSYWQMFLICFK